MCVCFSLVVICWLLLLLLRGFILRFGLSFMFLSGTTIRRRHALNNSSNFRNYHFLYYYSFSLVFFFSSFFYVCTYYVLTGIINPLFANEFSSTGTLLLDCAWLAPISSNFIFFYFLPFAAFASFLSFFLVYVCETRGIGKGHRGYIPFLFTIMSIAWVFHLIKSNHGRSVCCENCIMSIWLSGIVWFLIFRIIILIFFRLF